MNKYGFRLVWSDEDEGFIATSPEFPGLSAFGETEEQALGEAKVARSLFIADMRERGEELPEPQIASEFSGQTRLRLPKSLHRRAAELDAVEGVSLNQFIVEAVSEKIGAEKGGQRLLGELRRLFDDNAKQRRTEFALVAEQIHGTQSKQIVRTSSFTELFTETTRYIDRGH